MALLDFLIPEGDLLGLVCQAQQFHNLNKELRLSCQTEVMGDGLTLSTVRHLGCRQPGVASVKKQKALPCKHYEAPR